MAAFLRSSPGLVKCAQVLTTAAWLEAMKLAARHDPPRGGVVRGMLKEVNCYVKQREITTKS